MGSFFTYEIPQNYASTQQRLWQRALDTHTHLSLLSTAIHASPDHISRYTHLSRATIRLSSAASAASTASAASAKRQQRRSRRL